MAHGKLKIPAPSPPVMRLMVVVVEEAIELLAVVYHRQGFIHLSLLRRRSLYQYRNEGERQKVPEREKEEKMKSPDLLKTCFLEVCHDDPLPC